MAQFIPTPEDVRDRVRYADTVADAILPTFSKRDGDTIETQGYTTSGVGGNKYTYHLTGRSAVTTDLGFYIAGSGVDDYLEAQNKTIVRMDQFGLVDDSYSADQSAVMQNAWDTASLYGGLQIEIPAGKYAGTVLASYPAEIFPSVKGVAAHTYLKAANANEFALTCLRGRRHEVESVSTVNDTITITAHGLTNNEIVRWAVVAGNTPPAPFVVEPTNYYVINSTADTFQLATSAGGAAVDITDTGTGTSYLNERGGAHFKIPVVEDITFYGGDLPAFERDRHGLQVNFGDVFHVKGCYFYNHNIGLANNGTWGLYCDANSYRNNQVAELLTGRNDTNGFVSSTNIADQTIYLTQPYELWTDVDSAGQSQNPTLSTHIGCDYTNNTVAVIYEVPDARYSVNYEANWFGGTIQGLTGVWVRSPPTFWARTNPPLAFYNIHWETSTDTTYDRDGVTLPTHDIVQEAGTIKIIGPSPVKRITQSGGQIYASDFSYPTDAFEQSGGAFVSCNRLLGHNINATKKVYANILAPLDYETHTGDSGIAARIPDRIPCYSDEIAEAGTLVAGADGYNANRGGYSGRTASTYNGSTREYIAGESVFGAFARYTTTGSGNQGAVLTADPVLTVGTQNKPYFISVRMRASKAVTVTALTSGWNRALSLTTEWQTFGIIGNPQADFTFIYLYVVNDTVDLDIDSWQVVSFDSDYDLERYQQARHYLISATKPLIGREGAHVDSPASSRCAIYQVEGGDVHAKVTDASGYTKQGSLLAGADWGLHDRSLLTRLHGDGNEDGVDDTADWTYANLDATWTGTPTYIAGPTGSTTNAFKFDGASYLTLDRLIEVSDDFTISFWWKPVSTPSSQSLLDCLGAGNSGFTVIAQTDFGVRFYDGLLASELVGFGVVGEWNHIAITNIAGTLSGAVNGEPFGTPFSPTIVTPVVNMLVGVSVSIGQHLIGEVYDLRFYSRGFSNMEVNRDLASVAPDYVTKQTPNLYNENGTLYENRAVELNSKILTVNDTATGTGITINPSTPIMGLSSGGDISLSPTGNVQFGTHSAIGAETVTGYITIKDSGGTLRKIAVVS